MFTPKRLVLLLAGVVLFLGMALAKDTPKATSVPVEQSAAANQVIDRFVLKEKDLVESMKKFNPMVETYMQATQRDLELGSIPVRDQYFLGRLTLSSTLEERFYTDQQEKAGWRGDLVKNLNPLRGLGRLRSRIDPTGFAFMIMPDPRGLTRDNYDFQFLRREFLGDVRCLVFQVSPKRKSDPGRFLGRLWIEDQDMNIVRFNGVYTNAPRAQYYMHMDSWRRNLQPGVWLPSEVYSEETEAPAGAKRGEGFKAQTRLWGYDVRRVGRDTEFTQMVVEAPAAAPVSDQSEAAAEWSPVQSLRKWQREAEDSSLERLEKAALLAPVGPVDKILNTVVNNLMITNNLDIQPEVRCRVLLTSPLESLTIGHTIVISRGLLDVLPDEASLAMVLSHELAHVILGPQLDTKYAFGDRLSFADHRSYASFNFQRTQLQEDEADKKAFTMLKNSPYADKLGTPGLFLQQLQQRAGNLTALTKAHLGDPLVHNGLVRMADLMKGAPELKMLQVDQVAALPLGGRIKVDPWSDNVELLKTKPVVLLSAQEKMPFEVAPVIPHLTRLQADKDLAANQSEK